MGQFSVEISCVPGSTLNGNQQNSGFLARLEALDRQIVKASADVPGKEAGKSVLDEALEKGREALTQAIDAVRSAFSRQGPSAGPSISP